jgi:hypothetical protein
MPLLQYFGWVGSFLLAALLAAKWCLPAPVAPQAGVPLDQKIGIRIHTDHKWPERVVLDSGGTTAAQVRPRLAAREDLIFPSRLHKPPGKS